MKKQISLVTLLISCLLPLAANAGDSADQVRAQRLRSYSLGNGDEAEVQEIYRSGRQEAGAFRTHEAYKLQDSFWGHIMLRAFWKTYLLGGLNLQRWPDTQCVASKGGAVRVLGFSRDGSEALVRYHAKKDRRWGSTECKTGTYLRIRTEQLAEMKKLPDPLILRFQDMLRGESQPAQEQPQADEQPAAQHSYEAEESAPEAVSAQ